MCFCPDAKKVRNTVIQSCTQKMEDTIVRNKKCCNCFLYRTKAFCYLTLLHVTVATETPNQERIPNLIKRGKWVSISYCAAFSLQTRGMADQLKEDDGMRCKKPSGWSCGKRKELQISGGRVCQPGNIKWI